jgi:hypothetical protein
MQCREETGYAYRPTDRRSGFQHGCYSRYNGHLRQAGSKGGGAAIRKRYLPEYTASGNQMLPKNFDE